MQPEANAANDNNKSRCSGSNAIAAANDATTKQTQPNANAAAAQQQKPMQPKPNSKRREYKSRSS
jgi:hypothetical protein